MFYTAKIAIRNRVVVLSAPVGQLVALVGADKDELGRGLAICRRALVFPPCFHLISFLFFSRQPFYHFSAAVAKLPFAARRAARRDSCGGALARLLRGGWRGGWGVNGAMTMRLLCAKRSHGNCVEALAEGKRVFSRVQHHADESPLLDDIVPKPRKVGEIPLADGGTALDLYSKDASVIGLHDEIYLPLSGVPVLRDGIVRIDVELRRNLVVHPGFHDLSYHNFALNSISVSRKIPLEMRSGFHY